MERVDANGNPGSILVVLPTWVGDFVMATPALRAMRERFTDAHITFLMESNLRDLVGGGNWMNECVQWPERSRRTPLDRAYRDLIWDLRRRRFDWTVLFPNSFRSALTARIIGAKRRIGYDRDGRGFLLTDRLPVRNRIRRTTLSSLLRVGRSQEVKGTATSKVGGAGADDAQQLSSRLTVPLPKRPPVALGRYVPMPIVEYYADLVEAIGCRRPGDALELFTTPDDDDAVDKRLASEGIDSRRPLIVISPGAKFGASKCWMPERFAGVADRLIDSNRATVIVTCGPGEERIAREIGREMKGGGFVFDQPLLTLGQLKSLIRRCDLLICNDTGPRHFAKAFATPVVTVFGPTHPDWTATSHKAERIVRVDIDCGPCQQKRCPLGHHDCMTRVSIDAVFDAATALLRTQVQQIAR